VKTGQFKQLLGAREREDFEILRIWNREVQSARFCAPSQGENRRGISIVFIALLRKKAD
jgi:hypothetical protein